MKFQYKNGVPQFIPASLYMSNDGTNGAGGGAAGGEGGGGGGVAFSEVQLKQIGDVAAEVANRAITARNKAYDKRFEEFSATTIKAVEKSIAEIYKTLPNANAAGGGEGAGGEGGDKGKGKSAGGTQNVMESPEVRAMRRELDELKQKSQEAEAKAKEAEALNKKQQLRAMTSETLAKHGGMKADAARRAIALLEADGRIKYDDDDQPIFVGEDGDIKLEQGIKDWLKTEDGKSFLPPRGTQGSGERPGAGKPNTGNPGQPSRAELGAKLLQALDGRIT